VELTDVSRYVSCVPQIDRVCTVDEMNTAVEQLAAERQGVCRVRRVGTSRLGEPLRMLSVGHGARNALVVGCPHPNEPIGLLTVLNLARLVAETPELREGMDYTWNFVPCIDPDGTRLNERWFAGPRTIRYYHENFYRPAFSDQPEWTFPVLDERAYFDRTLPETQALARVIDELRPRFQYSLHNADFGGVFFILSRDVPGVADDFAVLAADQHLPLSFGPMDTLGWPAVGPAVYLMPPAEALIAEDERRGASGEARHGGSSSHYAERYGTTTLIAEVPLWHDKRCSDTGDSGRSYDEVLRTSARKLREDAAVLTELRQRTLPHLVVPSPMRPAVADFLESSASVAAVNEAIAATVAGRQATVAEQFSAESLVHMLRLRASGVLCRLLTVERAAGNQPPSLRAAHKELDALFDTWCECAEKALSAEPFPLQRLVAMQMASALAVLRRLDG
jgi:hypothetical protein